MDIPFDKLHKMTGAEWVKKRRKRRANRKPLPNPTKVKGLTLRHRMFLIHYLNPDGPTFLNATQSYYKAGYKAKTHILAQKAASHLMDNPIIYHTIKDALQSPDIDDMIQKGVKKRLEDPLTQYWQPTADYVAKVRGDFAPTQQVNMNLTPEDRNKKYDEILELIEKRKRPLNAPLPKLPTKDE